MKKLKHLDMNDNNFTSGLEYLPIELSGSHLISILAPFNYNLKKWREENVELTAKTKPEFQKLNQKIEKFEQEKKELDEKIKLMSETVSSQQKKIVELEEEVAKNEELQEDFLFYKQFFYNHLQVFHDYLQNKKNKLSELKNKLDEEGREWLEFYCESQQEKSPSLLMKKQMERAKVKLKNKLSEQELQEFLVSQKQVIE